ncbi:MAG: LysR family transcriptional regulator [Acidaminococcaceae bacterium]|nr:LysR family transcriptional regulator [Acidaminococcaceae bacterium]
MDIEYYRNFIAIVEAGSILGASKKLAIAQPALSNQIKVMQRYFDTQLIIAKRGGHRIELTDAGRVLLKQAKAIVENEQNAIKEIADCNSGFSGTLRISLSPSMSIWFIRRYLTGFAKKYPKVNFELHEGTPAVQAEQMLSGKTEFCVANAPLEQSFRFETIYSRKERLVAFFHKNSLFLHDNKPNMLLDDLDGRPVCLSQGCANLFLAVCADSHIRPQILSINTTKLSAMAWAREDAGISIVPAELEEGGTNDLVRKIIMDERLYLDKTLSIVKGRPLSNVAETFLSHFHEEI